MIDKHDFLKSNPFSLTEGKDKVLIYYNGKQIMILKGNEAHKIIRKVQNSDDFTKQLILAKITGHFKH